MLVMHGLLKPYPPTNFQGETGHQARPVSPSQTPKIMVIKAKLHATPTRCSESSAVMFVEYDNIAAVIGPRLVKDGNDFILGEIILKSGQTYPLAYAPEEFAQLLDQLKAAKP